MRLFQTTCAVLLASITLTVQAQQYYGVIGVFSIENNAKKFTGYARSLRLDARYELHTRQNLFYVFVFATPDREAALKDIKTLQEGTEFRDAWVYKGTLGSGTPVVTKSEPVEQKKEEEDAPPHITEITPPVTPAVVDSAAAVKTSPPPEPKRIVKGKLFRFAIQTEDGQAIPGSVHHVDYVRGRDLTTYSGGEAVDVLPPPTANNPMTVVCGIFGYKEVVRIVDYTNPALTEGATQDEQGTWVIPYPMVRMKKGDVSVMYHVSFYKDAVVMLPESKAEIDELVNMMKTNPNYKITIHGHCNGNNDRRIIALGTSKNYFNITGSDERKGSAKDLSRLRAEAIRSYLEDNGIEKSRSEIFAWGGTNMLVSETSTSAKLNDRIEIEITDD